MNLVVSVHVPANLLCLSLSDVELHLWDFQCLRKFILEHLMLIVVVAGAHRDIGLASDSHEVLGVEIKVLVQMLMESFMAKGLPPAGVDLDFSQTASSLF